MHPSVCPVVATALPLCELPPHSAWALTALSCLSMGIAFSLCSGLLQTTLPCPRSALPSFSPSLPSCQNTLENNSLPFLIALKIKQAPQLKCIEVVYSRALKLAQLRRSPLFPSIRYFSLPERCPECAVCLCTLLSFHVLFSLSLPYTFYSFRTLGFFPTEKPPVTTTFTFSFVYPFFALLQFTPLF